MTRRGTAASRRHGVRALSWSASGALSFALLALLCTECGLRLAQASEGDRGLAFQTCAASCASPASARPGCVAMSGFGRYEPDSSEQPCSAVCAATFRARPGDGGDGEGGDEMPARPPFWLRVTRWSCTDDCRCGEARSRWQAGRGA
eukprot:361981-Chlamydomonas_euryale.AAC.2